jgi:hypothetical protein
MSQAALAFMILSVGTVTVLFGWCLARVLRSGKGVDTLAHVEPVETDDLDRR